MLKNTDFLPKTKARSLNLLISDGRLILDMDDTRRRIGQSHGQGYTLDFSKGSPPRWDWISVRIERWMSKRGIQLIQLGCSEVML